MQRILIIACFVLASALVLHAEPVIYGRVTDAKSGEGLLGVNLQLTEALRGTSSDASGRYHLREAAFTTEREFTRRSLEGELAASLFGSRGRIEASFESDQPIQCALKVLSDRAEYNKLLSAPAK